MFLLIFHVVSFVYNMLVFFLFTCLLFYPHVFFFHKFFFVFYMLFFFCLLVYFFHMVSSFTCSSSSFTCCFFLVYFFFHMFSSSCTPFSSSPTSFSSTSFHSYNSLSRSPRPPLFFFICVSCSFTCVLRPAHLFLLLLHLSLLHFLLLPLFAESSVAPRGRFWVTVGPCGVCRRVLMLLQGLLLPSCVFSCHLSVYSVFR